MSPDDIDSFSVDLFDFLVGNLGCDLGENEDFESLLEFLHTNLEEFVTRDRNYN